MEQLDESLEFFSPEGKPLRASVSISLAQQKILVFPPVSTGQPGVTPTKTVPNGKSAQQALGPNWQDTAQRNNLENPRRPPPGKRLR
jgi:hypothetical protein